MQQNAASDQCLHRLLTEFSFKNLNKNEKYYQATLKTGPLDNSGKMHSA